MNFIQSYNESHLPALDRGRIGYPANKRDFDTLRSIEALTPRNEMLVQVNASGLTSHLPETKTASPYNPQHNMPPWPAVSPLGLQ